MGNTSIIAFNHDMVHEIFESKESKKKFLDQLEAQFGSFAYDGQEILGGEVVTCFPLYKEHTKYQTWLKFKEDIKKIKDTGKLIKYPKKGRSR